MGAEQQPSVSRSFGYQDPRAGERGGVDPQTGGRADEALPRDCNCDLMCPGVSPCICLVIYSDETGKHGTCECWCSGGVAEDRRYGLDQIVDFNLRAAPLGRVGFVLASKCTADIYIPALDLDKPMTLWLKRVTLETAIREAGLMALDRG
jgi:hypothetical protein